MNCTCGHAEDEHGTKDKKAAPKARECLIDGCDCAHFEWDGQEESR